MLQLSRQQDRFTTEVGLLSEGNTFVPVLRSIEGDPQQPWPPSPPFQDFLHQVNPEQEFLAGVGMAGHSHWSASLTAIRQPLPSLEWDLACRIKQPPTWLGSTYQLLDRAAVADDRICIEMADVRLVVEPSQAGQPCNLVLDGDQLRVSPRIPDGPLPRTIRWIYRVSAALPS